MIFRGGDACGSAPQSAYAASTGGGEIRELSLIVDTTNVTVETRKPKLIELLIDIG